MSEIKFEHVSLKYGKQEALKDINVTLKENTICGLLGRNGAGKTSLMTLLASYRPTTEGRITVDGMEVFDRSELMSQIALVRNRNEENNSMKVKEYLHMAATFRPNWDAAYAKELLEKFEIPQKKAINSLSTGRQAALRGIVGLAGGTQITLFDEAYQGMDAAVRKEFIGEILEDYTKRPHTILFSTHYIDEVESMLEEVIVLSEGKVLVQDECDNLRSKGIGITGNIQMIDNFVKRYDWKPVSTRTLGNLKEIVMFEQMNQKQMTEIKSEGATISRPSLQDLFIHITDRKNLGTKETAV